MRVQGLLRGESALTHFCPRFPFSPPRLSHSLFPRPLSPITSRMASATSTPEWTAHRVRETFLDFFKEHGHTFGALRLPRIILAAPPRNTPTDPFSSAFVPRRSSVRPDATIHQCWHEPVQVHLPRNCGSLLRLCEAEARCKFTEGWKPVITQSVCYAELG